MVGGGWRRLELIGNRPVIQIFPRLLKRCIRPYFGVKPPIHVARIPTLTRYYCLTSNLKYASIYSHLCRFPRNTFAPSWGSTPQPWSDGFPRGGFIHRNLSRRVRGSSVTGPSVTLNGFENSRKDSIEEDEEESLSRRHHEGSGCVRAANSDAP
jgi:hypothetical protein